MTRQTQTRLKLAGFSLVFLSLTILVAMGIRMALPAPVLGRGPASVGVSSLFEHRGNLSSQELGMLGSTPFLRGRRALFHTDSFRNLAGLRSGTISDGVEGSKRAHARPILLNLFPDLVLTTEIHEESTYMVNDGLYTGVVVGDPESSVRLMIQNGSVDGTIEFHDHEYRIFDGGNGSVIITESAKR